MDLRDARAALISAAREAGLIALRYFKTEGANPSFKADHSPVTVADLAIDAHLRERLKAFSPNTGWLSEESLAPTDQRPKRQAWVVDPIDGTRAFVAGSDDWVVSLALVEEGRPIVAVIFRPATGELYDAVAEGGARLNGQRISVSDGGLESVRVFTGPQKIFRDLQATMPRAEWLRSSRSVALRLAQLAQGVIDTALVKVGKRDWDLAAGDLILSEAGGRLTTSEGAELSYDLSGAPHPNLIGAGARRHAAFLSAFRAKRACFD